MKTQNRRVKMAAAVAITAVLGALASSQAADIPIANHSFQSPVLSSGSGVPDDWIAIAGVGAGSNFRHVIGLAAQGLDPRPDGTSQNSYSSDGGDAYQVLAAPVQANSTYTLTIDVGKRSDLPFPPVFVRLGVGNTFGSNLLPYAGESSPPPPDPGWTTWTAVFDSGPNPPAGALRVELINAGGQQPHFDNVRLSVEPTAPVAFDTERTVFVFNHSFERNGPVATAVTSTLPIGWLSTGTPHQDGLIGGAWDGDPRPDGSAVNAYLKDNNIYQLTGERITAGTTYTLTVDVAARLAFPAGTAIRLGTGDTFGEDLLTMENIVNPSPTPHTAWELWSATATVADGDPLIGEPLRIELYNPGGQQPQFDNVRLTAFTVAPAAKGTLLMLR